MWIRNLIWILEKQTKEIIQRVGMLQRHLVAYDDYFKKIGIHLGTTVNTYNSAYKEFKVYNSNKIITKNDL